MRLVLKVISLVVVGLGMLLVFVAVWDSLRWQFGYETGSYAMFMAVEAGVFGVVLVVVGAVGERMARKWRAARTPGVCPTCGYDVRGLERGASCPECGRGLES